MSLGKGLGALITPTVNGRHKTTLQTGGAQTERIWTVPHSDIQPNPAQPRRQFKDEELAELAQSIKEHGILQPILVSERTDGGYEIIAGERRWRAAGLAGLTVMPVIVKEIAEEKKLEIALIENIQREDLNPIEEAFAYKRLAEEFGLTQQQIADKVGKSRSAIANMVRLLELPEEIREALVAGKINTGQARALLSIEKKEQQLDLLASMLGQKITVRELEHTAQTIKKPVSMAAPNANLKYFEQRLREALGAKVRVSGRPDRGTIIVEYFSHDELEELIKKLAP